MAQFQFPRVSRLLGWTHPRPITSKLRTRHYRPHLESLEDRMLPSTFVVTSRNDSGTGSLRSAILSVNADPSLSLDVIDFNIPPTAPPFINIVSPLPVITHQVFVDGSSQPGFISSPIVDLKGPALPLPIGLAIRATGAVTPFVGAIKALKIDNFVTGISIQDAGSSTPANMLLINNSIMAAPGGNGIVFLAGTADTTAQIVSNSITTVGMGRGIAVLTAGTTDKFTFAGNTITASGGGDGILTQGTAASASLTYKGNKLSVQTGGQGIALNTSPNTTAAAFVSNMITTVGGGHGVAISTTGQSAVLNFVGNTVHASGGGDAVKVSGNAMVNDLTVTSVNQLFAKNGADALHVTLSPLSKTTVRVVNNLLNTSSLGTGLLLQGGPMFQALVQGNDCNNNRVGVAVFGNGVTAGNVDLGGGSLGSTGGNNFKSFVSATPTSYAIGLFHVASGYSMHAMLNLFSVSPLLVIADGSHDPGALGSGAILT